MRDERPDELIGFNTSDLRQELTRSCPVTDVEQDRIDFLTHRISVCVVTMM